MAFLDEVKRGLTTTGKQVAKKTKEITNTVQLKAQIASEKDAVKEYYAVIGRKVFERESEGDKERFEAEFAAIRKSEAKIKELEEQLSDLDGSIFCAECGARIDKNSVFCSHCGTKVDKSTAEIAVISEEAFEEESDSEKENDIEESDL